MKKNRKPTINPFNIHIQLIFYKKAKSANGERIVFVTNRVGKSG